LAPTRPPGSRETARIMKRQAVEGRSPPGGQGSTDGSVAVPPNTRTEFRRCIVYTGTLEEVCW